MKDKLNSIGLDIQKSKKLAKMFNELLSEYQILYMNTRGFHWNIKGDKFFELHLKFEELYNNFQIKIDELAERILTLGFTPLHSFEDYLKTATIKPVRDTDDGKKCIESIMYAFAVLIKKQRQILSLASETGDEGSNALMSDYIREQEKLVWMFKAYTKR